MRKFMFIVFLLLLATASQAAWVKVLNHVHQTKYPGLYDDGYASEADVVAKAKELGYQAVVMTPHYRADAHKLAPKNYDGIIVFDGAEIATYWGKGLVSHLLVVGDFYGDETVNQLANHYGTQQKLIDRLNELNLLTVAAHPNLIAIVNQDLLKGEPASFIFNVAEAKGLSGKEVFNDKEAYGRTMQDLVMDMNRGQNLFVTGGCDSHGLVVDLENNTRWTRTTWVWVDGAVTKESILNGMRQGQTYASQYGACIKAINFVPRSTPYETENLEIKCTIAFLKPVSEEKIVNLYFNNDSHFVGKLKKGESELSFSYLYTGESQDVAFMIEMENCLITSPIRLRHTPTEMLPETGADLSTNQSANQPITTFTGGLPMLLGKNYQEVQQTLERVPDEVKRAADFNFRLAWIYNNYLIKGGKLEVHFENLLDQKDRNTNQVHWIYYQYNYETTMRAPVYPKISSIVPKEILERKPDLIARVRSSDTDIVIIWLVDGKTFVLQTGHSTKKAYDQKKIINQYGLLEYRYYLNDTGRNFLQCDTISKFIYADCQPQMIGMRGFKPNEGNVGDNVSSTIWFVTFD